MDIPITKTVFQDEDFRAIQEPLRTGWIVQGAYVKGFEEGIVDFTKGKYAVACSSCTAALTISLAALGINQNDEVIVPAFTWVATANAAESLGAKVVFCDIDIDTFNINVEELQSKITPKTRAIMPVHLFGLASEMNAIIKLAKGNDAFVIEDAACALGSYYDNVHVGNFGDFGCFSFHPRKAITTGEGGIILTHDLQMAEICRSLRNHGASVSDLERHRDKSGFLLSEFNHLGYNFRMTDIQAALGLSQLKKINWISKERRSRANRYNSLLRHLDWLQTPIIPGNCLHSYQSYVCLFTPEIPSLKNIDKLHNHRNHLMLELQDAGITTRQGTHAVTTLGYYKTKYNIRKTDFQNALFADKLTITLPLYAQMTDEEQDYVVDKLIETYRY